MRGMPVRRRLVPSALALMCACALGSPALGAAQERMVMLYSTADAVRAIAGGPDRLDATAHNLFQQQPVAAVLAPTRQAWKVSARGPSRATPGLRGRSAESMATLLKDRIRRSGARKVFIDEAGLALHTSREDVVNLAAALEILSQDTLPALTGSQPLNERVHIYMQGVPAPLVRADWEATWRVLALAGGVWWQAYTTPRAWNEAEWSTWPRLIMRRLSEHGGDPARLRWVLRHDPAMTIPEQFANALRGDACAALAGGVGVWRPGPEAVAFRDTYRAIADGALGCAPAPQPTPAQAAGLDAVTGLEAGVPLTAGTVSVGAHGAERLPAGSLPLRVPARLRLNLGPDPLGIAGMLGVDAAGFWAGAGASVRITGGGLSERVELAGRPVNRYVLPTRRGPLSIDLQLPVRSLRAALGGPGVDLLAALESAGGPRTRALERRLIQSPAGAVLSFPLRTRRGGTLLQVRTARAPLPSRVQLLFPGRLAGGRIAPRHLRPVAVRMRDGRGDPVAGARARLRLPGGRWITLRAGPNGVARPAIARRGGPHLLTVPGTRVRVVRALTGPRGPSPTARTRALARR
jgi:hypothetical protein